MSLDEVTVGTKGVAVVEGPPSVVFEVNGSDTPVEAVSAVVECCCWMDSVLCCVSLGTEAAFVVETGVLVSVGGCAALLVSVAVSTGGVE